MPSPGFGKQLDEPALELRFPLELNKGIQCHGILTDRCEEVNNVDGGVSQITKDKEQGNVMVSDLMDSDSMVKKPNKDADRQLKKLHLTRGAKTVLPQPTVQQAQQTQMKEPKAPRKPKLISTKSPFAVAVPVKGPKSVEFNAPDEDIDDSMFNIDDISKEDSGEVHSIFDGLTLLDTNNDEAKMITKPLTMQLGANGSVNNGANGGSEIQTQMKGTGNNAVKRVSSTKQNGGSSGGGRQMQNVNDVALGVSMMGLAGSAGTCQTGGGSVDCPHTGSKQLGSGGVDGAAMGMPVRGTPGFYQQGGAAASSSMPIGQAMLQDAVAARNTMAARQQHIAPAQQQQQPKVSRSKKMQ